MQPCPIIEIGFRDGIGFDDDRIVGLGAEAGLGPVGAARPYDDRLPGPVEQDRELVVSDMGRVIEHPVLKPVTHQLRELGPRGGIGGVPDGDLFGLGSAALFGLLHGFLGDFLGGFLRRTYLLRRLFGLRCDGFLLAGVLDYLRSLHHGFRRGGHAGRLRLAGSRCLAAGGRENEIQPRLVLHQQIDEFEILKFIQREMQGPVFLFRAREHRFQRRQHVAGKECSDRIAGLFDMGVDLRLGRRFAVGSLELLAQVLRRQDSVVEVGRHVTEIVRYAEFIGFAGLAANEHRNRLALVFTGLRGR